MQRVPLQGNPGADGRGADQESGVPGDVPFADSINPQALYPHEAFQDVLAELAQAKISDREGATLITGASGAGKTSLIARLLAEAERAEGSLRLAGNEELTFSKFLKLCAEGFGLPAEFANAKDHLKALSAFLVERARSGRSSTIVIDPADNLNARFLGELSEFATWSKAGRRLSNVILTGQGTSGGQAGPRFAGVKIALHCHLHPLSPEEVGLYLSHHLRISGRNRPDLMESEVVAEIAEFSDCIPGKINRLARALFAAAPADSDIKITPDLVARTAQLLEAGEAAGEAEELQEDTESLTSVALDEDVADREIAPAPATPLTARAAEPAAAEGLVSKTTSGQAWPLDLTMSEKLNEQDETPIPEPAVLKPRRRAGRFWLGAGASGLAAGLLLMAALHQVWPDKINQLMEDYQLRLPSMDQVAETFHPAKLPGSGSSSNDRAADAGPSSGDMQGEAASDKPLADTAETAAGDNEVTLPLLDFAAEVGREDQPLPLQSSITSSPDMDLAEVKVTMAGLPPGARLSAGVRDKTGLWHLEADELQGLTLLPPTDYSGNFGLAVSIAMQRADGEMVYSTQALPIHIKAVPDVPLLRVATAEGEEGDPVSLDIQADLVDKDGSEILTLFLSNLPEGARLSAGKIQADGSWLLKPTEAKNLRLIPPIGLSGGFTLTIMALASERNGGSTPAKLPMDLQLNARGVLPQLTVAPVAGPQSEPLSLALAASLVASDGSESLYLLFKGLPEGASLSAGRDVGDGVWRVEEAALSGLKILPPEGWSGGFDMEVTAVAQDQDGSEMRVSDRVPVRFDPVAPPASQVVEASPAETQEEVERTLRAEDKLAEISTTSPVALGEDFDIAEGDRLLAAKDLTAARQYFQQAQAQGHAKAMTALGVTYDPQELVRLGIPESESDSSLARHWYLRGVAAGDLDAVKRLQALTPGQ